MTEIWDARPEWSRLSVEARQRFFEEKIGPLLSGFLEEGAEILACAINDNTGSERMNYRYMAVWRLPDKKLSDRLETAAKEAGFLEYFDQTKFSGSIITPDVMNGDMIQLQS